jgi:hypothetical protein
LTDHVNVNSSKAMEVTGIWFGSLVDHHAKKTMMQVSAAVSLALYAAAFAISLAAPRDAFTDPASVWLWTFIVPLMFGVIAGNIRTIALPTLVTLLIAEDSRDRANGLVGTASGVSFPVTSVISGALVAIGGMFWVLLAVGLQPAAEATVPEPTAPVTGNATYFDGLGAPYGGCGLPQAELETQNFVALNVFNTPGDSTFYTRPLPPSMADKMGIWNNGHNCGRWVQVKIADYCTGTNDGALGQPFCRNGSWTNDGYNGGVLNMIVADSCGDANSWCRDDPYHLDLSKDSLNRFVKNGAPLGDLYPNHWNNRHVDWSFVPAPAYSGDIQIGFLSGAQRWWPAVSVSRLANGIHGVEYFADGTWHAAQMNGDMSQSFSSAAPPRAAPSSASGSATCPTRSSTTAASTPSPCRPPARPSAAPRTPG